MKSEKEPALLSIKVGGIAYEFLMNLHNQRTIELGYLFSYYWHCVTHAKMIFFPFVIRFLRQWQQTPTSNIAKKITQKRYQMVHACWWYYFSKFTEFLDTVSLVRFSNQVPSPQSSSKMEIIVIICRCDLS